MNGNRRGFTLIEVLIAVVLVGTLAAIAIPRYAGAKDRAYAATMQADLHIAAIYEEQYGAEHHGQYFSGIASTGSPVEGYSPSKDVTVTFTSFHILGSQLADWTAIARHANSSQSCEMRAGITTCTTDNTLTTGFMK